MTNPNAAHRATRESHVPDLDDAATPAAPKVDWEDPVSVRRLRRDLRTMATTLGAAEVRGLIETYYMLQADRIRTGNRIAALQRESSTAQPPLVLQMFHAEQVHLEALMKPPIEAYVKSQRAGRWLLSVKGIGPILAGALLSYIDIERTRSAGSIERYAGMDPTVVWERGKPRPWNADLKKTMWLVGESFVKVKNREGAFYGALYDERKRFEVAANERGDLAEAAAKYLIAKQARTPTRRTPDDDEEAADWSEILKTGRLPPFLVDKRARRKAVSMFVNHLYEVLYECKHGVKPPHRPYVIDILGHKDYIPVPGWPIA